MNKHFITIEGIDGAGKSTFIPTIQKIFTDLGFETLLTREPGGTTLGETLREILLNVEMDNRTEILLAFAARNEHIHEVILPMAKEQKGTFPSKEI